MNLRSALLILALLAIGLFALLNWTAFTTPTTLSVGFAEVQAPLVLRSVEAVAPVHLGDEIAEV